jgi:hypothetical protein
VSSECGMAARNRVHRDIFPRIRIMELVMNLYTMDVKKMNERADTAALPDEGAAT